MLPKKILSYMNSPPKQILPFLPPPQKKKILFTFPIKTKNKMRGGSGVGVDQPISAPRGH